MSKARRFPSLLKRILRILGIVVAVAMILFGAATWIVVENKNALLLDQIQASVNESQSGQLDIGSLELKLFRSFPNVTIELDSIYYYEKKDSLRTPGEVPILHADKLYVAMGFAALVRGEVQVSAINLTKSELNIVEYPNGTRNLDLALAKPSKAAAPKKSTIPAAPKPPAKPAQKPVYPKPAVPKQQSASMNIDLDAIQVEDLQVTWHARNQARPYALHINDLEASFESQEKIITVEVTSSQRVESFRINRTSLPAGDLTVEASLIYDTGQQRLSIRESKIDYDIFTASIKGTYTQRDRQTLDVQIDGSSNDMALLSRLVRSKILRDNPNMLKQGDIYIKGRVFGELQQGPPHFDFSFGVRKMTLLMSDKLGSFSDIGFEGRLVSGRAVDYSEALLTISDLNGKLPGGYVKGQFRLKNFLDPYVKYKLDAQLKLDGYDQVFNISALSNLSGTMQVTAGFAGPLNLIQQHVMDSSRSSLIQLKDVGFTLSRSNLAVTKLTGTIEHRNNQLHIKPIDFTYGNDDIHIEATVDNLLHYLINDESNLAATGSFRSGQLFTNDLFLDSAATAAIQERASDVFFDFTFNTPAADKELKGFDFDVRNLRAQFDQLPNISQLDARGSLGKTSMGMLLDLKAMKAKLPQGNVQASGNLLFPEKRKMAFTAQVNLDKVPWTYVQELAAEIKEGVEPSAKNLPVTQMPMITANVDLTAAIHSYPFDITHLDIRDSRIRFELPTKKYFAVEKLNAGITDFTFQHPPNSGQLTGMKSVAGTVDFRQLKLPGLNEFDISLDLSGSNDLFNIGFSCATQQAKRENGEMMLDLTGKVPGYELRYVVSEARLESFIEKYHKGKFMEGLIDYTLNLKTIGNDWTSVKNNMKGTIEITGDSLNLYGIDIDDVLTKFKKSQAFNLTDLGAVVVAGPLGLVATKGSDFVALATVGINEKQMSKIQILLMKWKLDQGVLTSEDVAFATRLNRIAIDGSVDFKRDSVPGIRVAVIDKNGCSLMDQNLYGKFTNMKHGKLNVTKTLLGSVTNFVNAVVGAGCKPIYVGKVENPAGK